MSEAQAASLSLMVLVGWIGVIGLIEARSLSARIACWAWIIFWSAPPLVLLWLKGVMG
jgi:hypothetical protein